MSAFLGCKAAVGPFLPMKYGTSRSQTHSQKHEVCLVRNSGKSWKGWEMKGGCSTHREQSGENITAFGWESMEGFNLVGGWVFLCSWQRGKPPTPSDSENPVKQVNSTAFYFVNYLKALEHPRDFHQLAFAAFYRRENF